MLLTDTVKIGDRFKNADGKDPNWSKIGGRDRFNGSTYANMLEWGLYLYQEPTFNKVTHKTGAVNIVDDYSTKEVIEKIAEEIADDREVIVSGFKSNMRQVYHINAPEQAQINRALARLSADEIIAIDQWMDKCRQVYDEKKQEMKDTSDINTVDISFDHLEFSVNVLVTLANRTILQKISDYWFR